MVSWIDMVMNKCSWSDEEHVFMEWSLYGFIKLLEQYTSVFRQLWLSDKCSLGLGHVHGRGIQYTDNSSSLPHPSTTNAITI